MLDCEHAEPSVFYIWFTVAARPVSGVGSLKLGCLCGDRTLQTCFSLWKAEMKPGFEGASVFFSNSRVDKLRHTLCTIYYLSLSAGKNPGLNIRMRPSVDMCIWLCVFVSVGMRVCWRDSSSSWRGEEKRERRS